MRTDNWDHSPLAEVWEMSAVSVSSRLYSGLRLEAESFERLSEDEQTALLGRRLTWFFGLGFAPTDALLLAVDPEASAEEALPSAARAMLH